MGKSIYSLVLNEEVMKKVDRLADERGITRSTLVNEILANAVSYETPDMKLKNVFSEVKNIFFGHDNLRVISLPSGRSMTIKSTLPFRYKPTLKYSVEIYPFPVEEGYMGELKVSSRSGSDLLISEIENFYRLFIALERKYLRDKREYGIEDGCFKRTLCFPRLGESASDIAKSITGFINVFDMLIGQYFSYIENPSYAVKTVEQKYIESFNENTII